MNKQFMMLKIMSYYAKDRLGLLGSGLIRKQSLPIPRLFDVKLTFRCNLRCCQCYEWQQKEHNELSVEQWKRIFLDIRQTIGPFYLRFYGGEPFMFEGILELIEFCSRNDILILLTTNGTVYDPGAINRLVRSNVVLANVSIDGSNAGTHDALRGVKGVFEKAMFFVERVNNRFAIELNTTVMHKNVDELIDLAMLAKEKKISISYQAVINHRGEKCAISNSADEVFPKDIKKTLQALDKLIALRKQKYPIVNSIAQLERIKQYYAGTLADNFSPCEAVGHHLRILPDGRLNLCPWTKPVGNLANTSLTDIWRSPAVNEQVQEMLSCEKFFCRVMRGGHKETIGEKIDKIKRIHFR